MDVAETGKSPEGLNELNALASAHPASLEEVLSLLRAKNRCLERILNVCSAFLERWGTLSAPEDARSQELARLQEKRVSYFRILELYDQRISAMLTSQTHKNPSAQDESARLAISEALEERSRIVREIMDQDNQIMVHLESEKVRILEELAGTRKSHSIVNKFKSSWVPGSGEGLDRKL